MPSESRWVQPTSETGMTRRYCWAVNWSVGPSKTQRIEQWQKYCLENTDAQIMCWRGGLRSALAQQWLAAQGVQRERVAGGFKAVRHGSLHVLANPQKRWWLVSGRTGSAKTPLIQSLENGIDLEGHANHRGSAFGRRLDAPTHSRHVRVCLGISLSQAAWREPRG